MPIPTWTPTLPLGPTPTVHDPNSVYSARSRSGPTATALRRSNVGLSYYSEIVAYLATRPHGATPEGAAAEFGVAVSTMHSGVARVRKWLGADPTTGKWYLPEATSGPSARTRGVGVYEVTGILVDADLFRRLRARSQAHGAEGIADLVAALSLVEGRAFDQLRKDGFGWLAEDPLDHHLTAGVVDVAHLVATHALANGDKDLARWAAEIGITAAPSDDKPRLDLAAATGFDLDTAPLSDSTYDDTPRTQAVKQNRKPGQHR